MSSPASSSTRKDLTSDDSPSMFPSIRRSRSGSSSNSTETDLSPPPTPSVDDFKAYEELMLRLFPPGSLPPPPQPLLTTTIASASQITASSTKANVSGVSGMDDEDGNEITIDGVRRSMTKAEKQNAKKRRRKERERAARLEAEAEAGAQAQNEVEAVEGDGGLVDSLTTKHDQRSGKAEKVKEVVQFRLYSSCPLKDVSIVPAQEEYRTTTNPRHIPFDPKESDRRRRIAHESAIPSTYFGSIFGAGPSHQAQTDSLAGSSSSSSSAGKIELTSSEGRTPSQNRVRHLRVADTNTQNRPSSTLPDIFIGTLSRRLSGGLQRERTRIIPSSKPRPQAQSHTQMKLHQQKRGKMNPHVPGSTSYSVHIIPLTPELDVRMSQGNEAHTPRRLDHQSPAGHMSIDIDMGVGEKSRSKSKTRRGHRKRSSVLPKPSGARFYAPPVGLGGKARGYAWGYRDSMEGRRDVGDGAYEGYVRSKGR